MPSTKRPQMMNLVRKKDENPLLIFKTTCFLFFSGGVKLKTLSAEEFLFWLGHPYDFVVISDDQMTAGNMVPWLQ